jgi:hypothetical protein
LWGKGGPDGPPLLTLKGKNMSTKVKQIVAKTSDVDIDCVNDNNVQSVTKSMIVFTHTALALNETPVVTAGGSNIVFGARDSDADYELVRVSSTQSVARKNVSGSVSIQMTTLALELDVDGNLALGIGDAVIGESLIIQ